MAYRYLLLCICQYIGGQACATSSTNTCSLTRIVQHSDIHFECIITKKSGTFLLEGQILMSAMYLFWTAFLRMINPSDVTQLDLVALLLLIKWSDAHVMWPYESLHMPSGALSFVHGYRFLLLSLLFGITGLYLLLSNLLTKPPKT